MTNKNTTGSDTSKGFPISDHPTNVTPGADMPATDPPVFTPVNPAVNEKTVGNNPTTVVGEQTHPEDTHPKKPLDGSPVKTQLDQHGHAMSGQSGYVPKTVAQHNAEVDEKSEEADPNKK